MTLVRRFLLSLASVALVTLVLPAQPAHAVGCYSTGCNGKNPQVQNCDNDARTLEEISYAGARFQMRYSQACHAVWTRTLSTQHFNTLFGQIIAYTCSAASQSCRKGIYGAQVVEGTNWTKMWSFTYWVRTCYSTAWFDADPNGCSVAR